MAFVMYPGLRSNEATSASRKAGLSPRTTSSAARPSGTVADANRGDTGAADESRSLLLYREVLFACGEGKDQGEEGPFLGVFEEDPGDMSCDICRAENCRRGVCLCTTEGKKLVTFTVYS